MQKFILIQRDFTLDKLYVHKIKADNYQSAQKIVRDEYDSSIQNWLITPAEAMKLTDKLTNALRGLKHGI